MAAAARSKKAISVENAVDAAQLVNALDAELRANARPEADPEFLQKYLGRERPALGLRVDTVRNIAKRARKSHRLFTAAEWVAVLDALYIGEMYDHRLLAGILLGLSSEVRTTVEMATLRRWIGDLRGWAEIDATCQSTWNGDEMLARWDEWQPFLASCTSDENISLRRASLVLLCKPTRTSADPHLRSQAFANIDALKAERAGLITKAVSWLLRDLIAHNPAEVAAYLDTNAGALPAIAVRETRKKLATGKKSGRVS